MTVSFRVAVILYVKLLIAAWKVGTLRVSNIWLNNALTIKRGTLYYSAIYWRTVTTFILISETNHHLSVIWLGSRLLLINIFLLIKKENKKIIKKASHDVINVTLLISSPFTQRWNLKSTNWQSLFHFIVNSKVLNIK